MLFVNSGIIINTVGEITVLSEQVILTKHKMKWSGRKRSGLLSPDPFQKQFKLYSEETPAMKPS